MGDVALALSIPIQFAAVGIYAAIDRRRRRRHPAPHPSTKSAARLVELELRIVAEGIVADAYPLLADLYEVPTVPDPERQPLYLPAPVAQQRRVP